MRKKRIEKYFRRKLIRNATKEEEIFIEILNDLRIKYKFQKIFKTLDRFVIVDFFIEKFNVVIEIDGKHHNNDVNVIIHDKLRTEYLLKNHNISEVIRYSNCYVANNYAQVRDELKSRFLHSNDFFFKEYFKIVSNS